MLENGMALFALAMALSCLACAVMCLVHGGRRRTERDDLFDRIAMRAVVLSDGCDVSMDDVCEALSGEDMSGFRLSNTAR